MQIPAGERRTILAPTPETRGRAKTATRVPSILLPTSSSSLLPSPPLSPPLSIYEAIGRGAHSTVYKGRKKQTIQYYAVKSVSKARKPRVLQEVRAMHALAHPSVLAFHAWYETANHLWLVLEYCVGGDLLGLLAADGALPEGSVHDLGAGLAAGLAALHAAGGLHRDVKPSNVLLDEAGSAKLGGFGLSVRPGRSSSNSSSAATAVAPGSSAAAAAGDRLRGSPAYMPPEALWAAARVVGGGEGGDAGGGALSTPSTPPPSTMAGDLYSLGAVLYHLAAGRPPFTGGSLAEVVAAVLGQAPPPLPPPPASTAGASSTPATSSWSPEFVDLVTSLLRKRPGDRPTWAAVAAHPFWRCPLSGPLPSASAPTADTSASDAWMDAALAAGYTPARLAAALSSSARAVLDSSSGEGGEEEEEGLGEEGEGEDGDQGGAKPSPSPPRGGPTTSGARAGDVRLESADAEVDFGDVVGVLAVDKQQAVAAVQPDAVPAVTPTTTTPMPAPKPSPSHTPPPPPHSDPRSYGLTRRGSLPLSSPGGPGGGGGGGSASVSPVRAPAAPSPPSSSSSLLTHLASTLVWTARAPGDASVSPIVGNPRVEGAGGGAGGLAAPAAGAVLPFADPLPLETVLAAPAGDLQALLARIYRALADPATSPMDADAALAYVCGLAADAGAANALVNSSLARLLVRRLEVVVEAGGGPPPPVDLPARAAAALGLLIRHATYVADELAGAGLARCLAALAEDGNASVAARRRAAAALGEVAFYAASQGVPTPSGSTSGGLLVAASARSSASAGPWAATPACAGPALVRLLSPPDADPIIRHCAAKAIENIAARADPGWTAALATPAAARALAAAAAGGYARVCGGGRPPPTPSSLSDPADPTAASAAATAASALARLLRLDPSLAGEASTAARPAGALWAALAPGGPPRARAPAAALLCAFLASPSPPAVRAGLPGRGAAGAAAATSLAALADAAGSSPSSAAAAGARGRALATAALALAADPGWLPCLTGGPGARLLASAGRVDGGGVTDAYVRLAAGALTRAAAVAAAAGLADARVELAAGRAPPPACLAAAVAVLAQQQGCGGGSGDDHGDPAAADAAAAMDAAAAELAAALGGALAAASPPADDPSSCSLASGHAPLSTDAEAAWEAAKDGGARGADDDPPPPVGRARAALLAGAEALLLGGRLQRAAPFAPPLDAALGDHLIPPLALLAGRRGAAAADAPPLTAAATALIEAERLTAVRLLAAAAELCMKGGASTTMLATSLLTSSLPAIVAGLAALPPAPLFAAKLADSVAGLPGGSAAFIRSLARCGALASVAGAAARGAGGAAALRLLSKAAGAGVLATPDALAGAGSAASAALRRASAGEAGPGEPEAAAWLVAALARADGDAAAAGGDRSLAARLAAGHGARLLGAAATAPDSPAGRASAAAIAALASTVATTPVGAGLFLAGPTGRALVSALTASRTGGPDAHAAFVDLMQALATASSALVRRGGGGLLAPAPPGAAAPERPTLVALRSEARASAAAAAALVSSSKGASSSCLLETASAAAVALDGALGV